MKKIRISLLEQSLDETRNADIEQASKDMAIQRIHEAIEWVRRGAK